MNSLTTLDQPNHDHHDQTNNHHDDQPKNHSQMNMTTVSAFLKKPLGWDFYYLKMLVLYYNLFANLLFLIEVSIF